MNSLKRTLLTATAALLLTTLAFAQTDADKQFMSEAAQASMTKINMAYLALQNSQNEQVKAYARRILSTYGQAQNDLIYVANHHGVVLPKTVNTSDAEALDSLSKLHGAAFDKAFVQTMLNGDQTEVSTLQQQATKLDNPAIMKWASTTLPTLQGTLNQAQKVAPAVGIHPEQANEEQAKAKNEEQPAAAGPSDSAQQNTQKKPAPRGSTKPPKTGPRIQQY